jgi:hypothetical protein
MILVSKQLEINVEGGNEIEIPPLDWLSTTLTWWETRMCSNTVALTLLRDHKLCQKERVALLRHSLMDESNMLNDCSELHGSCSHTARFHHLSMRSSNDDYE